MPEPRHKRGRSKQDYQTPPELLMAVRRYLGIRDFSIDLAAARHNTVHPVYFTEDDDALQQSWHQWTGHDHGWGWCNPPFAHIEPWVKHASTQMAMGAQVAMLLPAGIGSNWFRQWVHLQAFWLALNGRLTFMGQPTCYPKDCILVLWDLDLQPGASGNAPYDVWEWDKIA